MTFQSELHYNVDSVVIRDHQLFGFGWLFLAYQSVRSLHLELHLTDGDQQVFSVDYNKPRDDVASAFPGNPYADRSGFLFYGAWRGAALSQLVLVVETEGGKIESIPLPQQIESLVHDEAVVNSVARTYLLNKAKDYILRGRFRALWRKGMHHLKAAPDVSGGSLRRLVECVKSSPGRSLCVVVDHSVGGWANIYRERLIKQKIADGEGVLLFTYHIPSLQFMLELRGYGKPLRYAFQDVMVLFELLTHISPTEIFYNNGVSFAQPELIPELLMSIKRHHGAALRFALHDYFLICPSHFLLNDRGRYCTVPSIAECQRCLAINHEGFVSLFAARDIEQWRAEWGKSLELADEIICFSDASRALLLKAYPMLRQEQLTTRPHEIDCPGGQALDCDWSGTLHIGVIGQIGRHKGAQVVGGLSHRIAERGLAITITVIGVLEAEYNKSVLSETGPYERDRLVDAVAKSGANLFLFPSIWPETFSYVTAELIQLSVPLVCFDLGAPAERVRNYRYGTVIPFNGNTDRLLDNLIATHQRYVDSRNGVAEV